MKSIHNLAILLSLTTGTNIANQAIKQAKLGNPEWLLEILTILTWEDHKRDGYATELYNLGYRSDQFDIEQIQTDLFNIERSHLWNGLHDLIILSRLYPFKKGLLQEEQMSDFGRDNHYPLDKHYLYQLLEKGYNFNQLTSYLNIPTAYHCLELLSPSYLPIADYEKEIRDTALVYQSTKI